MYFNNITEGFKDKNGCLPGSELPQVPLFALLFDALGSKHPLHCVLLSVPCPLFFFVMLLRFLLKIKLRFPNFIFVDPSN
jgi:hypothetical protein